MNNSPKVQKALEETLKELLDLPTEQFMHLMDVAEERMKKDVLENNPNAGMVLWYGCHPESFLAYINKVLEEEQNG